MLKKKTSNPARSSKLPLVRRANVEKKTPATKAPETATKPSEAKEAATPPTAPMPAAPAETTPIVADVTDTSKESIATPKATQGVKPSRATKPVKADDAGGMSCLDAAVAVLKAAGEPMRCKAMIDAMSNKGLWKSDAPTPHQTLASALMREITRKGSASRFRKADRGQFTLNV